MAKSSAAKKTAGTKYFKSPDSILCQTCGHGLPAHDLMKGNECPPLPPPKQATIDEAVVSKGGKPSTDFERELAAATGADEAAERKKLALVNFEKRPGEPVTMDLRIEQLRPYKDNPRGSDVGDTSGLEKVMEVAGFLGVLVVREIGANGDEPVYEVIVGNRRLQAAKRAGLKSVPCDVYELDDVQALELNVAEQTNREDLTPLAEAEACRHLVELAGYSAHQVGEKFGKSAAWVTKRIQLAGVAPELRKAVAKGDLPVTLANALASLPTHQHQVKTFDALQARPDWQKREATAEKDAEWIRNTQCRPLADATWKLTDSELVPEAGPCSTCKHNSQNNGMPGLFDNVKAKPTCAKTECFDDKASEAWLVRTSKARSNGAKALSLAEGRKLFHGAGGPLPESSRYVEGNVAPKKDKKGRTWAELAAELPEEHQPQLHLAQDGAGKLRQLYVGDKLLEAIAEHLKLKWAANFIEEATSTKEAPAKEAAKREEELKEQHLIMDVRKMVTGQVLATVAAKLAADFARPAALWLVEDAADEADLTAFAAALGRKLPKDWAQKGATNTELLAFSWFIRTRNAFNHPWQGFDESFLDIAKAHGFKLEEMVKAQLATAKAEAEK